jgi:arsenate reductase
MDILIKMGCGVVCPFVFNNHEEDWNLEDPVGKSIDEFRKTRDIIKEKTEKLIEKVKSGEITFGR